MNHLLKNKMIHWMGCLPALLLASCRPVGPNYTPPAIEVPDRFVEQAALEPNQIESVMSWSTWWEGFHDPELTKLVLDAQQTNPDLHVAVARLQEARALQGIADSQGDLTVDATGSVARRSESLTGVQGPALRRGLMERNYNVFQAGFDAAWELDLFGRVRRGREVAAATSEARLETLRDIQVSLQAEVATQYMALRLAQQQLAITEQVMAIQQETLDLQQQKYDHGLATQLEVTQADIRVRATASRVPSLRQEIRTHMYRLSVLLACEPVEMVERLKVPGDIPDTNSSAPGCVPADLLRRRPDVRRAERELAAATAGIGLAQADLYPRLTLTGTVGWNTLSLNQFNTSDSGFFGVGPGVRWPLLNGNRIRNQVKAADARTDTALALYEKTLYTALGDVESALTAFGEESHKEAAIHSQIDAQDKAVSLARQLHEQGLLDKPGVFAAEETRLITSGDLLASRARRSTALVQLFKAMGGGWQE